MDWGDSMKGTPTMPTPTMRHPRQYCNVEEREEWFIRSKFCRDIPSAQRVTLNVAKSEEGGVVGFANLVYKRVQTCTNVYKRVQTI